LNLQTSANGANLSVTGIGAIGTTFFSQSLSESLLFHMTKQWEFSQALSFRAFIPIDPRTLPDTYTTGLDLGFERIFRTDSIGLDLRSEYGIYETSGPLPVGVAAETHQVIETAFARWRRDWNPFWTTEAGLGGLAAVSVARFPGQNQTGSVYQPYAL